MFIIFWQCTKLPSHHASGYFFSTATWNVGWPCARQEVLLKSRPVKCWMGFAMMFLRKYKPKCNSEFPLTNDGRMEDDLPFERWQILSGYVKLPGSKTICFRKGRFFVNHSSTNPREVVKMSLLTAQGWKLGGSYAPFLKHQLCIAPRSSRYMLMFLCRRKVWSYEIYIYKHVLYHKICIYMIYCNRYLRSYPTSSVPQEPETANYS